MKKLKVVEFFGEPLNYGGQEAFILNVYSNINKEKLSFTFITPFECENTKLKDMILKNNDKLIVENKDFNSNMRKKYIIEVAKKYLSKEIDVIHIHSGSTFTLYNVAKIAKKCGISKIIVHSHATGKNNLKYRIIKFISDLGIDKYTDYYFACSDKAAKWKFPKKVLHSEKLYIINNGINIEAYKYNKNKRDEYRKQFNVEKDIVVINIGRFSIEKNQLFLIDVFRKLVDIKKNAKLLLVGGTGDLLDSIKKKIKDLKLDDNVIILTNRPDVNYLINMSDVFVLPSLWEGLPFTGIEAQANGIPCIFSNRITEELNITPSYNSLPIENAVDSWANTIIELSRKKRINNENDIRKHGFDISESCIILERIYNE